MRLVLFTSYIKVLGLSSKHEAEKHGTDKNLGCTMSVSVQYKCWSSSQTSATFHKNFFLTNSLQNDKIFNSSTGNNSLTVNSSMIELQIWWMWDDNTATPMQTESYTGATKLWCACKFTKTICHFNSCAYFLLASSALVVNVRR